MPFLAVLQYEGKRFKQPELSLETCTFQNGTLHEYKCNKSNPIAGVSIEPCQLVDPATDDPFEIAAAIENGMIVDYGDYAYWGDCCSTKLDVEEADILCQDEVRLKCTALGPGGVTVLNSSALTPPGSGRRRRRGPPGLSAASSRRRRRCSSPGS